MLRGRARRSGRRAIFSGWEVWSRVEVGVDGSRRPAWGVISVRPRADERNRLPFGCGRRCPVRDRAGAPVPPRTGCLRQAGASHPSRPSLRRRIVSDTRAVKRAASAVPKGEGFAPRP